MRMQRLSFDALGRSGRDCRRRRPRGGSGQSPAPAASAAYDPAALPSGELGDSIKLGRDIVMNTQQTMPGYVRAKLECASCHVEGGTVAKGGSFIGTASYFPQCNPRANRVITLQDRLAECFPLQHERPAAGYASKEMVAMVCVHRVAFARNAAALDPARANRFIEPLPSARRTSRAARRSTRSKCATAIRPAAPASPVRFRRCGARVVQHRRRYGAHRSDDRVRVATICRKNAPGSLSLQDAYDVSAYVLSHDRPAFAGKTLVENSPLPAGYY